MAIFETICATFCLCGDFSQFLGKCAHVVQKMVILQLNSFDVQIKESK